MQKKNFEIERLTSELQKKEYEISWLRAKLDSMTDVPVLIAGDEDDFYPGEAKDFVLSAVKKELSATEVRTRRYDVLSDILNVNNYEAIGEQRAEEAKRLLSNYKRSFKSDKALKLERKASSFTRQAAATEGKYPQRLSGEKREEASARRVAVNM